MSRHGQSSFLHNEDLNTIRIRSLNELYKIGLRTAWQDYTGLSLWGETGVVRVSGVLGV